MSDRYSKYILDSIKKKFGAEGKYEEEGFPGMNYEVGNTSGLDVAPGVPSAMDERIGSLAQRGGSVMEVIINNPATFQLDKDKMFNVINQLGINISIHSNPDIGYTNPNRQAGGGYEPTHSYFTRYLEQFAIFKKEAEVRAEDEENFGFEIQRINPHISTSRLPALEEERPGDTGLDPFGYSLTEITESEFEDRDRNGQNIYRNTEFLKRLYKLFIVEEIDYEYQFYDFFANFSDKFENEWNEAQKDALDYYFDEETGPLSIDTTEDKIAKLEDKIAVIRTSVQQDPGAQKAWLNIIEGQSLDEEIEFELPGQNGRTQTVTASNLEQASQIIQIMEGAQGSISQLRALPEAYHYLEQADGINPRANLVDKSLSEVKEILRFTLEKAVNKLWEGENEGAERKMYNISIDAQKAGINNRLEVPGRKITEKAYRMGENLEEEAVKTFSGEEEYFEDGDYFRFFRSAINNFQQQMWMESNIMYRILPAWMDVADEEYDGHEGWDAPKFVWELLVKRKWENKKGYNIDLKQPRGEDGETGYLDLLENSREFQADVAAASAACYAWGHFTQKEGHFKIEKEKHVKDIETYTTWIDWMNEYGIGVNLESMPGSPQQMYKIWRPKDIVAACRAINITARKELDDIHEDLDGMPAKFTIDLEHTATFGLDPWKTMEELIEQEKDLAKSELAEKYELDIDPEKPLAKVLRMWHLMRAGLETSQAQTLHGPWDRGDKQLYEWLYKMIDAGFARNPDETAYVMYEVGGDDRGTVYTARIAMNLIELGVEPEQLDPTKVDPSKKEYGDEKEALMARFFGMDKSSYDREWAKIEEHAFDPLEGLLEAESFDHTWSGRAALEEGGARPQEWMQEEYK